MVGDFPIGALVRSVSDGRTGRVSRISKDGGKRLRWVEWDDGTAGSSEPVESLELLNQCQGGVYTSISPPERCALVEGHKGPCEA